MQTSNHNCNNADRRFETAAILGRLALGNMRLALSSNAFYGYQSAETLKPSATYLAGGCLMHKIMISVGEASGDLNGAYLANALKKLEPEIKLFGMGGQAMRAAGVDIVYDIAELGVMGLIEILKS